MNDTFISFTFVTSCEIISTKMSTHKQWTTFEEKWDIPCSSGSLDDRKNALIRLAKSDNLSVFTENGSKSLQRAIIEKAINSGGHENQELILGLKQDGFEIISDLTSGETRESREFENKKINYSLKKCIQKTYQNSIFKKQNQK